MRKIITILLFLCILYATALFAGSGIANKWGNPEILFMVSPENIDPDGNLQSSWLNSLPPLRDAIGESITVTALSLPPVAKEDAELRRIFRLSVEDKSAVQHWLDMLSATSGVEWAEIAPIRQTSALPLPDGDVPPGRDAPPNDPYYSLQWYLEKISAPAGWDVTHGSPDVVVAVIDVGVDLTHYDLASKLWVNSAEKNGVANADDDGNGFVDDIYGWDFTEDDGYPNSEQGDLHGTHVAGIACGATDNGVGIAGIGWNCKIMAIRAGLGASIYSGYEAIIYAAANGADIINLSWGGGSLSNAERITVEWAATQGSVIVAAAGNNPNDGAHYPAAYPHVVGVGSVGSGDRLSYFSNRGSWVDISAPGEKILSTMPSGGFGSQSGTSMATPIVAGVAALVKSLHPAWSSEQIAQQLIRTADPIDHVNSDFLGQFGSGRVNMYRALADQTAGFEIADLEVADLGNGDSVINPGESIELTVTLKNLLAATATVSGRISSKSNSVSINPEWIEFGSIAGGATAMNNTPFELIISANAYDGEQIECLLTLDCGPFVDQSIPFSLIVNPNYVTQSGGNVAMTLTNFGVFGYWDYIRDVNNGVGFRSPLDGLSTLFHGSLMLGHTGKGVSDCAFGDNKHQRFDFVPEVSGFPLLTTADGQVGTVRFTDRHAENPLQVTVKQVSYSYKDAPDDDYIVLEYTITNNSGTDYADLYAGLYFDWDVVQAGYNRSGWDEAGQFGFTEYYREGHPVVGCGVIGRETGFRSAVANSIVHPSTTANWSDSTKLAYMTSGFTNAQGDTLRDWSELIGCGSLSLPKGDSLIVRFAVAAGETRAQLADNIQSARAKWAVRSTPPAQIPQPQGIQLVSLYPSPFNSVLTVTGIVNTAMPLRWTLYDPSGREVLQGDIAPVQAGGFSLSINAGALASGRYLLELTAGQYRVVTPLTLVR